MSSSISAMSALNSSQAACFEILSASPISAQECPSSRARATASRRHSEICLADVPIEHAERAVGLAGHGHGGPVVVVREDRAHIVKCA